MGYLSRHRKVMLVVCDVVVAPSVNSSFCNNEEVRCSDKNLWLNHYWVFRPNLNFPKLATDLNVFALTQQTTIALAECPELKFFTFYILE